MTWKRFLVTAALASLALLPRFLWGEPGDSTCVVRMKDGSVFVGKLTSPEKLTLRVKGETKTFAGGEIWSATWGDVKKEELDRVVTAKGAFAGELQDTQDFEVDTGYGTVKLPVAKIVSIRAAHPTGSLSFDFTKDALVAWTAVGPSDWKAEDGRLHCLPTGRADRLLYDVPLEGAYTLEVDVQCAGWTAVLFNSAGDGNEVAFWLMPGLSGIYSVPDWQNTQIAGWKTETRTLADKPAHVKLEVNGKHVKAWLDGVELGECDVPFEAGRFGFGMWTNEAWFDNVRVTR